MLCESDSAVLRDHIRNALREQKESATVIILLEQRNHFAAKAAHFAVRQDWLEAVADRNEIFVVVGSEQNQDSAIFLFGTDSPLLGQVYRVIGGFGAVERAHCDDRDLRAGLLIDFLAEDGEFLLGAGTDHTRKIIHIALRLEGLDIFRAGGPSEREANQQS